MGRGPLPGRTARWTSWGGLGRLEGGVRAAGLEAEGRKLLPAQQRQRHRRRLPRGRRARTLFWLQWWGDGEGGGVVGGSGRVTGRGEGARARRASAASAAHTPTATRGERKSLCR